MRTLTPRSGVTLLELLLTLILFVGFAAALHAVVRLAAGQANEAMQRSVASRDHMALWALISRDLAHAGAGDVHRPSSTVLEFDRPIVEGSICSALPSVILLRGDPAASARLPVAGRDHLLLRESGLTGGWLRRGIVSVAMANCPDSGPALLLSTDTPIPVVAFARVVEPVRLRSYRSEGVYALGLESRVGAGTIQPIAGPINAADFTVTDLGNAYLLALTREPLQPLSLRVTLQPDP